MFKLIAFACLLAVVAAKPGYIGAPITYTAPAAVYSAPIATSYSASYSAPAYRSAYVAAPVVAAPVAYKAYSNAYNAPLAYSAPIVPAYNSYNYGVHGGAW